MTKTYMKEVMAKSKAAEEFLGHCLTLVEKQDKTMGKRIFNKIGQICRLNKRRKELKSYGVKPDVIIINLGFRQDYKRWRNRT